MDLVLISENSALTHELQTALREAAGSEPQVLGGKALLEGATLPPADVVLVDRHTWQEYCSLYRYFGALPMFDRTSLVCVTRGKRSTALKGRVGCNDVFVSLPTTPEQLSRALDESREHTEQMRLAGSF
jgi:hypothetical protein